MNILVHMIKCFPESGFIVVETNTRCNVHFCPQDGDSEAFSLLLLNPSVVEHSGHSSLGAKEFAPLCRVKHLYMQNKI